MSTKSIVSAGMLIGILVLAVAVIKEGVTSAQPERPQATVASTTPPASIVPPLEPGKRYTFYWERGQLVSALVLEAPRGNWVKVRYGAETVRESEHWVNLYTITYLVEVPKGS